jgi:hypothetical protein
MGHVAKRDMEDLLHPVLANGDTGVHLAFAEWTLGLDKTLCRRVIGSEPPMVTFRDDACLTCANKAMGVAIHLFRDTDSSVVDLGQLITTRDAEDQRSRSTDMA